jgi:hypothetical protein
MYQLSYRSIELKGAFRRVWGLPARHTYPDTERRGFPLSAISRL